MLGLFLDVVGGGEFAFGDQEAILQRQGVACLRVALGRAEAAVVSVGLQRVPVGFSGELISTTL